MQGFSSLFFLAPSALFFPERLLVFSVSEPAALTVSLDHLLLVRPHSVRPHSLFPGWSARGECSGLRLWSAFGQSVWYDSCLLSSPSTSLLTTGPSCPGCPSLWTPTLSCPYTWLPVEFTHTEIRVSSSSLLMSLLINIAEIFSISLSPFLSAISTLYAPVYVFLSCSAAIKICCNVAWSWK